jgi:hypothetical protein
MHKLPGLLSVRKGVIISLPTETLLLPLLSSSRPSSDSVAFFQDLVHLSTYLMPLFPPLYARIQGLFITETLD